MGDDVGYAYTIIYALVVPLFGMLLDRNLRAWFVGARTGRSKAAWLGIAAAYAFYFVSYRMVLHWSTFGGLWNFGAFVQMALLVVVGLLPLLVNPSRKSYALTVTGFAWGVAGGLNVFTFMAVLFFGGQNYLTAPIHSALSALAGPFRTVSPTLSGVISDFNFLLEFLLPALVGYLIGWLRLRIQARRMDVNIEG